MQSAQNTIALLGATGKTGRSILRLLLEKDSLNLHVYVRSKQKLFSLFPEIATINHVRVCEGTITDQQVMIECLSGADTIICTLGENENIRGVSVLQDSARCIVTALEELKLKAPAYTKPRLLYLSSSSENERFAAARPPLVHWLIETAFYFPYQDLKEAQRILLGAPSLISLQLVQPPVLVEEAPSGYEISTDFVRLGVSYDDLAAGFVALACHKQYEDIKAIGVSSRDGDAPLRYAPIIFSRIFLGFLTGYVPGFWALRQRLGL